MIPESEAEEIDQKEKEEEEKEREKKKAYLQKWGTYMISEVLMDDRL